MKLVSVVSVILMFVHCEGVTLPEFWKKYVLVVQENFTKYPEMNLPQILYPCHSFMQQAPDLVDMIPYLPPIIVWNPSVQFRYLFPQGLICTVCKNRRTESATGKKLEYRY